MGKRSTLVDSYARTLENSSALVRKCASVLVSPVFAQDVIDNVATLGFLETIFANIVSVALTLAGLALFVMLLVGGFGYITSGGEAEAAAKARKTLTYALLGLVLVVAAFLILRLIEVFTGVPVTNFRIIQ